MHLPFAHWLVRQKLNHVSLVQYIVQFSYVALYTRLYSFSSRTTSRTTRHYTRRNNIISETRLAQNIPLERNKCYLLRWRVHSSVCV